MQTTLNEINVSREEQLKRINDYFDSLESKVREGSEANDEKIQAHQNELSLQIGTADSTLLHLSTLQKHGHPVDILRASGDISHRLREWSDANDLNLGSLSKQTFEQGHLDTSKLGHILSSSIMVQAPTPCQPKVLNKKHIPEGTPGNIAISDAVVGADLVILHDRMEAQAQLATYDNDTLTLKHHTAGNFNRVCALPGNQYAATDAKTSALQYSMIISFTKGI
ncbi:unnamed protein product [Owenia fusiformis]|uniref:Uncharacterized protein n=1 Tax=Owenia fusiformis TaxID=6347 RepID=A0A8S4NI76_OWEFU|nr:unnamed protein product [Owenia fusiformis]